MLRRTSFLLSFLFLLVGCTMQKCGGNEQANVSPEDQLHSYITTAVNITKVEQKEDLLSLTSGPLRSALVNATDETFKKAYIDKKFDFKSFEILERKEGASDKEVLVEFRLKYKSWNAGEDGSRAPTVETTNRATLFYDKGQWSIYRVESQGSNFDWEYGLPLDDVSTKGVTPESEPVEVKSSREIDASEDLKP
jgi:hypothetical protein